MPMIIQVVGASGSGKTFVLERAIRRLRAEGYRVAALKHSHHPIDVRGKDTDRLRRSGANPVLFVSRGWALFASGEPWDLLPTLPVDVVLVEGYHRRRLSRHRYRVERPGDAPEVVEEILRVVRGAIPHPPVHPRPPSGKPALRRARRARRSGSSR